MQEEGKDYVVCQLCGEEFQMISHNHLKWKHGITVAEYQEQFPDSSMLSDAYRKSISDNLKVSLADENTIRGAKSKVIRDWIEENQGKHFCHCGCGEPIEIRNFHYTYGIPEYINNHYSQTDECKEYNSAITTQRYIDGPTLADRQSASLKQYYIDNPEAKALMAQFGSDNGMFGISRCGSDGPGWQGGKIGCVCEWCGDIFDVWHDGKFCSFECMGEYMSVFRRGEAHWNYQGGDPSPYCRKFNCELRTHIREKYGYCDYISGIYQDICNGGRNLCVHHIDYDRDQGCNDKPIRLVPLSTKNHMMTNFKRPFWERLFTYSLGYEEDYYAGMSGFDIFECLRNTNERIQITKGGNIHDSSINNRD